MALNNTHGGLLKLGDSSGGASSVYTTLAQLRDWNLPERILKTYPVTGHEDGATRIVPGKVTDIGKVKGVLTFDPAAATHANSGSGIQAVFNAKALRDWRGTFPAAVSSLTWTLSGVITKLGEIKMNVDGSLDLPFEIDVDGDVTIA